MRMEIPFKGPEKRVDLELPHPACPEKGENAMRQSVFIARLVVMKPMTPREMFLRATFIQWMGMELESIANGVCETKVTITADMLQQDGFVHAGIVTTLADHSCGGAVGSLLGPDEHLLTAEFKTSFLRAAKNSVLYCRAECVKRGGSLAFAEASVYSSPARESESLVARMSSTLAIRKLKP
jgi:uncharacterized protein (TIGR00369 family)